jgi:hypothetical protein
LFYCPKCVSEPLLILTERSIMAHIAIILSENNLSDIMIEEIVCRNTCFECNYNIWITFYIFLWNYESIKVGVHLVFNTIWDWKNDTKSFIFPKLKVLSVQNFEDNTTVLCTFCWTWCFFVDTRNGGHFVKNGHHFFIKFLRRGTCSKIIWSIFVSI